MKIKIKRPVLSVNGDASIAAPAPDPAPSAPALSMAPAFAATAPSIADGSKKPIKIKLKRRRDEPSGPSPAAVRSSPVVAPTFPLTHAPSELSSLSNSEALGRGMYLPGALPPPQASQPLAIAKPAKRIKLKLPSSKMGPPSGKIAVKKPKLGPTRVPVERSTVHVPHMPPPALPHRAPVPTLHSSPTAGPQLLPAFKSTKIKIKKTKVPAVTPAPPVRDPVPTKVRPPPRARQPLADVLPKRRKAQDLPASSPAKKIKVKTAIKPVQSGKQTAVAAAQAAKNTPEPKAPAPPVEAIQLPEGIAFVESLLEAISEENSVPEKSLLTMVNKLLRKDRENLFRTEPQKTNLQARVKAAYKTAIKQPMALATIRDHIRSLEGKPKLCTWKQMECALDLMVANCVYFNGDDSHLSKTARGIRAEFSRLREKDIAAEAMAAAAPAEQAADFMPRLRSAMTETLPPRRAAVAASLAREHAPRRGGRGGGSRAARVTHLTMRMLDTGIRRVVEPNARYTFHKKEADFTTFGCTLGAWNLETGRPMWLMRPRLAHAYPKRYVPFGSAALKQAFHLGSMCGRLADLIKSNAAKTVFLPRKNVPQSAPVAGPPSAAPQAAQQHAGQAQQYVAQRPAQLQGNAQQVHPAQRQQGAAEYPKYQMQQHAAASPTQFQVQQHQLQQPQMQQPQQQMQQPPQQPQQQMQQPPQQPQQPQPQQHSQQQQHPPQQTQQQQQVVSSQAIQPQQVQ